MLRKINYDTAAYIYDKWLIYHFPANEVKPLVNIKNMWDVGGYEAYAWYEGDDIVGYAFLGAHPETEFILLDYLAIIDNHRGSGYGSRILSELKNVVKNKKAVVIETENLSKASNKAEVDEREKRDRFYTKNGVVKSGLSATVYGAEYRVWYLPFDDNLTNAEIARAYDDIYKFMLSEKGYNNFFKMYEET